MTIRTMTAIALIAMIAPLAPAAAHGEAFQSKASAAYAQAIEEYEIPGLVVGVTRGGQHSFYATGLASLADDRPVTPDTLFELGSISKIFTATLAALAEQRGLLSLDDKASHHLCADACSIGDDMTLMDLATHHSGGLPLQVPQDIADVAQLVNWLKAWEPPQPGARSYSNVSIGLLGHITADAMGMSYTQAAQSVLFPALGLTNTWIDVPAGAMERYAFGYERKTDRPIRVNPGILDAEAYGVKSSARDMLRLLDIELGVTPVAPALEAAMRRTREGRFRTEKFVQDMIWEQYPWPADIETMKAASGYDFILHPQEMEAISPALPPQEDVILNKTGSTSGFGGYVALLPGQDIGIVVLANRNYPNEARISATYALLKALIPE